MLDAGGVRLPSSSTTALSPCELVLSFFFFRQLSTRFPEEDIDFASLNQSDQDVLKADVLSQLRHAMRHGGGAALEWDELEVTMPAYGGLTSVRLGRSGGNSGTREGTDGRDLVVRLNF